MASHAQFNTTAPSGSDQHWRVPQKSSAQLILSASQEERTHASVFNNSNGALYLKYGSNVGMVVSGSTGVYDVRLGSASYYELPKPAWQGEIWGAWENDAAQGPSAGFAHVVQIGRDDK